MTNKTDMSDDFWGHGLTTKAGNAKEATNTSSLGKKTTKKQQKEQYEQSFWQAIEKHDVLTIQTLLNDPLLPTLPVITLQDKIFEFFDEDVASMLEDFLDDYSFERAVGRYPHYNNPHPKLLTYLFEKGLADKDQKKKTSFLTGFYRHYLTDTSSGAVAIKQAILKNRPDVFDKVVGEQSDFHDLLDVFDEAWGFYQRGERALGDQLLEEFDQACWKNVILYLLAGQSYHFRGDCLSSKEDLVAFEAMFLTHAGLRRGYQQAVEQIEDDIHNAQRIMDTCLPCGIDFDQSPYWDVFSKHEKVWSTAGFKKPQLLASLSLRYGTKADKNPMQALTVYLRRERILPLEPDRYEILTLSKFCESDKVPKTPVKRWRCFTEAFLCGNPASFLKLDFDNLNQALQSACQNDDVVWAVVRRLSFDDLKNLVLRVPELKTKRVGDKNVGEVWASVVQPSSKTMLLKMFKLAPEWFEGESTIVDIFTDNGLAEDHLREFQKFMLIKKLRTDQGEAGRKTRSRKKTKRQM